MPDFDDDVIEPAMAAVKEALAESVVDERVPEDYGTQAEPLSINLKLENGDELTYSFKGRVEGTKITIDRYDAAPVVVSFGE